jgi:hypothetical protein
MAIPARGGAAGGPGVQVIGLNELIRDLRAMDRKMGGREGLQALNRELRAAANIAALEAKKTAPLAGMKGTQRRRLDRDGKPYGKPRKGYRPGRTERSIRGTSRRNQGEVQVRAKDPRTGFHYPFAYEFGRWPGSGPTNPHRPFLEPALYNARDEVMETLADGLTRVLRQYWQSTGSTRGGIQIG